jgi:flagellar FliL protein
MYWISCRVPEEGQGSGMSETTDDTDGKPARKGKSKLLLVAAALALLAGGGGFYVVYSGLLVLPFIDGGGSKNLAAAGGHGGEGAGNSGEASVFEPGAYVYLDPLIISLSDQSRSEHLKVTLAVEVGPGREAEIEAVQPRVIDILNGFLRAVDEREFELPRSMERLRAQMLRRVRLVTPEGAVRDLLIQEFLLN